MATAHKIQNLLEQVVLSTVKDGAEYVQCRIEAHGLVEILAANLSPLMQQQIDNGVLRITETTDIPVPPPVPNGVSADQKAALDAANAPDGTNPFLTRSDLLAIVPATKVLWVDKNRVDTYVEGGTLDRPFKTIAAATAFATAKTTIMVVGGDYTESVILPNNVNLFGYGIGVTTITGNVTTGTLNCHLRDFGVHGNIAINGTSTVLNVYCIGTATIAADCQSFNFTIAPASGAKALISSGNLVTFDACSLTSTGDVNTVEHTAGKLVLQAAQVNGNESTKAVIKSTGGMLVSHLCFVINSGGGQSIDCQNGATLAPNAIVDTLIAGNVVAGTAATIADAVYGSGTVTGTALLAPVTGSH